MQEITMDELQFFDKMPAARPLYARLRERLLAACPDTGIKVQRSQITFQARYGFAFVSLRRMKGCPAVFLIVSFGLSHRLDSPRIAVAVEPYPRRWTHHVVVSSADELDDELLDWLQQAHDFALTK